MRLSYKYRIYLNKKQRETLNNIFGFCCFLYNSALQERISYYKRFGKGISYNQQSAELPAIKDEFDTSTIFAQTLQQVLKRLDLAYKNFFRRVKRRETPGFPRYKSFDRFKSINFPQCNLQQGGVQLISKKKIKVFGVEGEINIKMHRPYEGRCKTVSIVKDGEQYYIVLSCDDIPTKSLPKTGNIVGIDLGLNSFLTTDDGTKVKHPKPYHISKEKLASLNQKLARKKKGSNNRKKTKKELQSLHRKIANIRNDFLHKLSKKIVEENDTIILEDLNIKGMLEQEKQEGKIQPKKENITDASWNTFANMLFYKAENAGRKVIKVDPKNTSKMCSCCYNIDLSQSLKHRYYYCFVCGEGMGRDTNAAINIKRIGMILAKEDQLLFQKQSALC